tara:strand:- start:226 stop:666 length:441 start_codon:yes stop_codon:yes gene_type:complete
MSKVISVVTTSSIGIWNIPMRGQNFINNHYATINNYKISLVIQESLFFNNYNSVKSVISKNKDRNTIVIFCSSLQLINLDREEKNFIDFFKNYDLHFSLELQKGKGSEYLKKVISESKKFVKRKNIKIEKLNSYKSLFSKYKNKII